MADPPSSPPLINNASHHSSSSEKRRRRRRTRGRQSWRPPSFPSLSVDGGSEMDFLRYAWSEHQQTIYRLQKELSEQRKLLKRIEYLYRVKNASSSPSPINTIVQAPPSSPPSSSPAVPPSPAPSVVEVEVKAVEGKWESSTRAVDKKNNNKKNNRQEEKKNTISDIEQKEKEKEKKNEGVVSNPSINLEKMDNHSSPSSSSSISSSFPSSKSSAIVINQKKNNNNNNNNNNNDNSDYDNSDDDDDDDTEPDESNRPIFIRRDGRRYEIRTTMQEIMYHYGINKIKCTPYEEKDTAELLLIRPRQFGGAVKRYVDIDHYYKSINYDEGNTIDELIYQEKNNFQLKLLLFQTCDELMGKWPINKNSKKK